MGFKKSSIWISGPQIVPYQIRQNVFNLKSTLIGWEVFGQIGGVKNILNPPPSSKGYGDSNKSKVIIILVKERAI